MVLGRFVPSRLEQATIASEFRSWLRERGIEPIERQIGVRSPSDTIAACTSTPVLMEWHRDGAGPDPTDPEVTPSVATLIVWSNGTPTQVRDAHGADVSGDPFDVVQFDNVRCWHKSPPPEEGRWFSGVIPCP